MTQPMPPNPNLPPEQLPDVGPLADAHQAALADLQQEWAGLTDKQKQQLVDAVYTAVAAGTVADLLTLPIDIAGATAALTAAMVAIAAAAAHLLVAEAADQGVHVPAVHVPAAVFEPTAQVVAGTLGDELRITAARAALQYGPDANPTDVADAARAALDARSGASETKQLGGALHGAMNTGRIASLRRAPTGAIYAQEMNDKNTCGPCREVNGRWLGNIPDDLPQILAMYPDGAYGGYISCLGGINCRGTITGVWRPDQVEAANRARILAKGGGQHRDHHEKPDYTAADLGLTDLHDTQVDPQDVNVDRQHYQRDLDPDEVDRFRRHPKRLAKRWGLLARRPDGSLWVVNGQHHTQAGVDEGVRQMRYRVFDSTGPAQEAKVYAAYQRWHDGWHAARPDEPRNRFERIAVEFNPDQPRGPDGRWISLVEHLKDKIRTHLDTGEGDPFEGYSREQLRRVARRRGIALDRGESRESIAGKLIGSITPVGATGPRPDTAAVKHARAIATAATVAPEHQDELRRELERQATIAPHRMVALAEVHLPARGSPDAHAYLGSESGHASAYYTPMGSRPEHYAQRGAPVPETPRPAIWFSPNWGIRLDSAHRRGGESGWSVPHGSSSELGGVAAHEFGHHVSDIMLEPVGVDGTRDMKGDIAEKFLPVLNDALGARRTSASGEDLLAPRHHGFADNMQYTAPGALLESWVALNRDLIAAKVSQYAAKNFGELLAEIWEEHSTRGSDARPHIRQIGELMRELAEGAQP